MGSIHFDGVSGAVIVSLIAFSIVFAVLFGLTLMIFAMRIFASSKSDKPKDNKPAGGTPAPAARAVAAAAPAAPAAPVAHATGNATGKIVAAITAAILQATNGMGRVLSVTPELAAEGPSVGGYYTGPVKRWKSSGVVRLVSSTIDRGWRR